MDLEKKAMAHVMPLLIGGDRDNMLTHATETTFQGELSPKFKYLQNYIDQA